MPAKLYLTYGTNQTLHFDGPDIAAPVKGSHYAPGAGPRSWDDAGRQVITEEIQINLEGTYRQITDWINTVSTLFHSAQLGARHQVNQLTLCVLEPDEAGGYPWSSPILAATLQLDSNGLAQRVLGQQLVTLRVTRLDAWQHIGDTPGLYFPTGQSYAAQNYIVNHVDADFLHSNILYIQGAAVLGSLPSQTFIKLGINQGGHALGDVLMGCAWPDDPAHLGAYIDRWEGELFNAGSDATKAVTGGAADCSGGSYATFTWSPTAAAQLAVIAASYSYWWHGRPLKPLLRLQASRAYTDLYLKLKVLVPSTAAVVYETEWVLYQANANFVEFPTLFCPPEGMTQASSLEIAIYALKATGGNYTLPVDVLQLWPIDGGFRRLKPLTFQAGAQYLVDDAYNDQVYWANITQTELKPALAGQGRRLALHPGRLNVLYFLNLTGGTTWTIDDQITVQVSTTILKGCL